MAFSTAPTSSKKSPSSSSSKHGHGTSALTSALKHVFYIHRDVVAELTAKIDLITEENVKLKLEAEKHAGSQGCSSCKVLRKKNNSLQEHYQNRLRDKAIIIKHLEGMLQARGEAIEPTQDQDPPLELLATSPLAHSRASHDLDGNGEENVEPSNTEVDSGRKQSRLKLDRERKRKSEYLEKPEGKRQKISPLRNPANPIESTMRHDTVKECSILAPETEATCVERLSKNNRQHETRLDLHVKQDKKWSYRGKCVAGNVQEEDKEDPGSSPPMLVIPETLGLDGYTNVEAETLHARTGERYRNSCTGEKGKEDVIDLSHEEDDDEGDEIDGEENDTDEEHTLTESRVAHQNNNKHARSEKTFDSKLSKTSKSDVSLSETINPNNFPVNTTDRERSEMPSKNNACKGKTMAARALIKTPHLDETKTHETPASASPLLFERVRSESADTLSPRRERQALKPKLLIADSKLSTDKGNNLPEIDKEPTHVKNNMPSERPSLSLKQSTLSQTFKASPSSKLHQRGSKYSKQDLKSTEEEKQIAEAIHRSLSGVGEVSNFQIPDSLHDETRFDTDKRHEENASIIDQAISDSEGLSPNKPCVKKNKSLDSFDKQTARKKHMTDSLEIYESPSGRRRGKHKETCQPELCGIEPSLPMTSLTPVELRVWNDQDGREPVASNIGLNNGGGESCVSQNGDGDEDVDQDNDISDNNKSVHRKNKESRNYDGGDHVRGNHSAAPMERQTGRDTQGANTSLDWDGCLAEICDTEQQDHTINPSMDDTVAPNMLSQYPGNSVYRQDNENDNGDISAKGDNDCNGDDVIDLDVFEENEEEDETIAASPQPTFNSQAHGSLPSSFKFLKPRQSSKNVPRKKSFPKPKGSVAVVSVDVMPIEETQEEEEHDREMKEELNCEEEDDKEVKAICKMDQSSSFEDSFDRLPREKEPEYAYVDVVRKQSERRKLQGFSCKQCEEYFKHQNLSEEQLQARLKECSRHKHRFRPPSTPEHFWSLGFPDTAEIESRKAKDHSNEQDVPRGPRRRTRLTKLF